MNLLHQSFIIFLQIIGILSERTTSPENSETDIVFRVINGKRANLGDVPYQISFRSPAGRGIYRTFCGGTIIGQNKILSAAHCFESGSGSQCCRSGRLTGKKVEKFYAVAGSLYNVGRFRRYDSKNGTEQWRKVKTVIYPKKFEFPEEDIAVVKTKNPFKYNKYVNRIPYATVWEEYKGDCLASGYGRTSSKRSSPHLLLAELRIIPTRRCSALNKRKMRKFVCTSDEISDVDKGDSGGPLVCKKTKNKHEALNGILVGVVSGKRRTRGAGAFFTRVSSYRAFIRSSVCLHTVKLPVLAICLILLCSINT